MTQQEENAQPRLRLTPDAAPTPGERAQTTITRPEATAGSEEGTADSEADAQSVSPPSSVYMGRRSLRVNLNARVLPHNKEMLDEICHRLRISQQQFVEDALEDAFSKRGYSYDKLFAA